jgi:hypothetical protein
MIGICSVCSPLNALQSAQQGINRGLEGISRSAHTVSHANVEGGIGTDVTVAMVESLESKLLVQLSVKMLTTAHEALGSLLDVRA